MRQEISAYKLIKKDKVDFVHENGKDNIRLDRNRMPADEETEIQSEAAKVSKDGYLELSGVH